MRRGRDALAEAALAGLGLAVSLAIFFHAQILNRFTVLFGDRYDGVIEVALLQHWFDVLRGLAPWNVTGYFYPWRDTLGYNDGYFLYGLIYSLFRALGADPFLATAFTHITVKGVGFFGMLALMRLVFARRPAASVLAAVVFTIADNSLVQAVHGQLFMVGFAPPAALLLWGLWRALRGPRRWPVLASGVPLAIFCGAWLISGFYMAWFFGFFMIVLVLVLAVIGGRAGWARLGADLRRQALPLLGVLAVAGASVLPCLMVYLPIARQTGMERLAIVGRFLPAPVDVLNLGTGNLLWGGLDLWLTHLPPGWFPAYSEWTTGLPPVLLILFLLGFASRRAVRPAREEGVILRAVGLATVVSWLLILRVGPLTLWPLVMVLVPGARGLRVISRYQIFLAAPLTILAVCWVDDWQRRGRRLLPVAVALLLVVEEINLVPPVHLDRPAELRFLAAVPAPPAACRAFFASAARPGIVNGAAATALYSHNVDAMLIAALDHLPTINGYSTFNPPDWNFADPGRADYLARVAAYAAAHRISGLCGLDLATRRWQRDPLPARSPGGVS